MIQRIQTIYLVLASMVSGGLIFVFNLWNTIKEKIFVVDLFSKEGITLKLIPFTLRQANRSKVSLLGKFF